ncbi:MAG: helix-turn-helix domain-containing protein [Elainellaceae cyanobacterium]
MKVLISLEFEGLGDLIKEARISARKSVSSLANEADMTAANWYKIENEETKALPLETLLRLEEILNIQTDWKAALREQFHI